jgi:hypothetical protein
MLQLIPASLEVTFKWLLKLFGCFGKTVGLEVKVQEKCNHGAQVGQNPCS